MESIENQEMAKIEIEIPKDALEFAGFYAKLCNRDVEYILRRILTKELKEYKTKVLELPLISERHTKARKNWEIT